MDSYLGKLLLSLLLCLCSCEERTAGGDLKLLCDGSEDIKMLFVFGLGAFKPGDTYTPEAEVIFSENGGFLYIKGNCEYWASEASPDPMVGDRIGTLSEREAADFVADLKYSQWDDLQGEYTGGQVSHGGKVYLRNDDVELSCYGERTESDEAPEKIRTIISNAWQWRRCLWEKGTKPSGALRVTASIVRNPDSVIEHHGEYLFEWPLVGDHKV